jgi:hypothetical protein
VARIEPSEKGFDESLRQMNRFVDELLNEASRIAARGLAEKASADHVRRAAEHLYSAGPRRTSLILTGLGSLIAGAGASAFASFMVSSPIRVLGTVSSVAVLTLGIVVAGVGLIRD